MRGRTVNLNDTEPNVVSGQGSPPNAPPGTATVPIENRAADTVPGGPPSASVLRRGHVVDRYRIVQLIASGGMARVYEAVHVFTQKSVALKVMHHRLSDRQDLVERFRHEAIALSSIHHRNVVNVENAGLTEDGHVFIAMDLLRGRNLRQVLESGKRFELIEALQLVSDVAEGVAAAHDIKIIHRDLKPENIFCTDNEPAKVLDLGTAKFAGDNAPTTQTAFGKVVGTAAYIAPERLEGEVGDERCDIYSLGLLLYECIAGFHPLAPTGQWPSAAEVVARQITYTPRPIPGLPSGIWNLIARAIHKKPDARFHSMHEFRMAITAAVEHMRRDEVVLKPMPTKSGWAGLGLPIIAGIIVGSGSAATAFTLRHAVGSGAADSTAPAISVPANQTIISKDLDTNAVVQPAAAAAIASAAAAIKPGATIVDLVRSAPNPAEPKPAATAVPIKSATKPVEMAPIKPVANETKPRLTNASRSGVEYAPSAGAVTSRPAKEDLPASGL